MWWCVYCEWYRINRIMIWFCLSTRSMYIVAKMYSNSLGIDVPELKVYMAPIFLALLFILMLILKCHTFVQTLKSSAVATFAFFYELLEMLVIN